MKIVTGADDCGLNLKQEVTAHLKERGIEIIDVGMYDAKQPVPYYEAAARVARKIQEGAAERGIIFCGTGMGVSIVANKFKGVYAGVVESEFGGLHCRVLNNCNVLTMGGWVITPHRAKKIADDWINASFTQGWDNIAGFLKDAFKEIQKIESQTMK
jgi:ribose 5-phosphate isomerase B